MGQRPRAHPVRLSTQLFVFVAVRTANISFVFYFIVNDEIPLAAWAFEFKQGFHDFSSTRSSPAVGHFWVRTEISSPWVALRIFWKARFIRTFASGDSVQCNDTLSRTSPPEPLRSSAIFPATSVPAIESRSRFWFLLPKPKILSV